MGVGELVGKVVGLEVVGPDVGRLVGCGVGSGVGVAVVISGGSSTICGGTSSLWMAMGWRHATIESATHSR